MEEFTVRVDNVKRLKRIAMLTAPHVKTTHRAEILARLLGWSTYSLMLSKLRSEAQFVNSAHFMEALRFCRKYGIDIDESDLMKMVERLEYEFGRETRRSPRCAQS